MAENQQLPVPQARAGDARAWDALCQRYQLPLYAYVFELVHHEQETLDIVQETFINAARHLGSLQDDAKFGSWLFSIAHQKCIQHWRRRDRRKLLVDHESADLPEMDFIDAAGDPADMLIRKEQEEEFMRLLGDLPLAQRSVLLLHFLEGFSLEEIAGITETQIGTVKSRIHYAKRALRTLLEKNHENTP